jgi:ankyrin repeat protein
LGRDVNNQKGFTALHFLARANDPRLECTYDNQRILGRQLIKHETNVSARAQKGFDRITPSHGACNSGIATYLDFMQLLFDNGADPNAQDNLGQTLLHHSMFRAPGAPKFVLEYSSKVNPNMKRTRERLS